LFMIRLVVFLVQYLYRSTVVSALAYF